MKTKFWGWVTGPVPLTCYVSPSICQESGVQEVVHEPGSKSQKMPEAWICLMVVCLAIWSTVTYCNYIVYNQILHHSKLDEKEKWFKPPSVSVLDFCCGLRMKNQINDKSWPMFSPKIHGKGIADSKKSIKIQDSPSRLSKHVQPKPYDFKRYPRIYRRWDFDLLGCHPINWAPLTWRLHELMPSNDKTSQSFSQRRTWHDLFSTSPQNIFWTMGKRNDLVTIPKKIQVNAMATRMQWPEILGQKFVFLVDDPFLSSCRVKTATRQSCQQRSLLGHRNLDQFLANRSCMVLWLYLGKDAGFIPATWKNHLQYLAMHLPRRELGLTLTFARHLALANELTVRKKIENRSPCFEQMQDSPQKMIVCAHAHQELESMTCRAHGLYRSIYMDIWKQSKLLYFTCTTICLVEWRPNHPSGLSPFGMSFSSRVTKLSSTDLVTIDV